MKQEVDLVPLGQLPPLGTVPRRMYAQTIRECRFGDPVDAFQTEIVDVPEIGPDEVLVAVMAAGLNYNNVWASKGYPLNVIEYRRRKGEPEDFHIGGSDASGIVYQIGSAVTNVKVGDEVVLHCAQWDIHDPWIQEGGDPIVAPSCKIWGYETNWGSFAQFTKVQARQCLPRPQHLSWADSASYLLCGMTIYRMLHHWKPNQLRKDDVVLIWGGSGGLGTMAIQMVRLGGGIPVAVVSSEERGEACVALGAEGYINRANFEHWGALTSDINDDEGFATWTGKARDFGRELWRIVGKGNNPRIVIEHPGEATMATSNFVCDPGGMVVTCAGTTGYNATLDLRFLWMRSKRLQGSHAADDRQAAILNDLVRDKKVNPCVGQTYSFEEIGLCHQMMGENRLPPGNMSILVGATGLASTGSVTEPDMHLELSV